MDLRTKINEKYKISMKSKNTDEINTLKLMKNAIKNKDIENRTSGNKEVINDRQILTLLQYLVKQRKDSIEFFNLAKRNDLADKETREVEIINQFLPHQLTGKEIKTTIQQFIEDNNLSSINEMGKVMHFMKTNYAEVVDMALAGKLAKELLNN